MMQIESVSGIAMNCCVLMVLKGKMVELRFKCLRLYVYMWIWRTYKNAHVVNQQLIFPSLGWIVKKNRIKPVRNAGVWRKTQPIKRTDIDFVDGIDNENKKYELVNDNKINVFAKLLVHLDTIRPSGENVMDDPMRPHAWMYVGSRRVASLKKM